jgi:hypothetical protein
MQTTTTRAASSPLANLASAEASLIEALNAAAARLDQIGTGSLDAALDCSDPK